jgi:hypothetical protein
VIAQLDEHMAVHAPEGSSSSRAPKSEFSLDGLPMGSASDLLGFAEQHGGLKRER